MAGIMTPRQQLLTYLYNNPSSGFIETKDLLKSMNLSNNELLQLIGFLERDDIIKGDGNHHDYFSTRQGMSPSWEEVSFKLRLTSEGRKQVIAENLSGTLNASVRRQPYEIVEDLAFIIMQIGDPELDSIYNNVYKPVLKEMGLNPKRIDQDNEGHLLKVEIIENIKKAKIIIADLTNERPNCYLEVGYAMGLNKYTNLIMVASEDHKNDSVNHKKDGPKIHFDISGYDIFFYDKAEIDEFKVGLANKVAKRLNSLKNEKSTEARNLPAYPVWDENWLKNQREYCSKKRNELGFIGTLEVLITPASSKLHLKSTEIIKIADSSQIIEVGWPFAIILKGNSSNKPVPKVDGLLSEVVFTQDNTMGATFDYTYFKDNGQIFSTLGLRQDNFNSKLFIIPEAVDLLIEILLYIERYYNKCGLPFDSEIEISLTFIGLEGRKLSYGERPMMLPKQSSENAITLKTKMTLDKIIPDLSALTFNIIRPLFEIFDFYEIQLDYVRGRVVEFISKLNK